MEMIHLINPSNLMSLLRSVRRAFGSPQPARLHSGFSLALRPAAETVPARSNHVGLGTSQDHAKSCLICLIILLIKIGIL